MVKKKRNDIRKLFEKVKLLILDVDGVLTKGEIIYDSQGNELKKFNVKDGLSIFLLSKLGLKTIIFTARDSDIVRKRAKDMGVVQVIGGVLPKSKALEEIGRKYKVKKEEICFVGDDLIDLSIMKRIGFPVAVKDAHPEVRKIALYVTAKRGGEGAVREVVENILKAKNLWNKLIKNFDQIVKR